MNIRDVEKVCDMFKKMLRARPDICPHEYRKIRVYELEDNVTEIQYQCKWCGRYKVSLVHHKPKLMPKDEGANDEK